MTKKRILLLGDSIIDNGAYVRLGEPDVTKQLQALLPDHAVIKRALDGAVCADVAELAGSGPREHRSHHLKRRRQ